MKLSPQQRKILKLLSMEPDNGLCRGSIGMALDIPEDRLGDDLLGHLCPLESDGLVEVVHRGSACRRMITEKGRQALALIK